MTFAQLSDLATGYWKAAALNAAVQLRLFEQLPKTAQDYEADLLDALAGMGLVEKTGDRYQIAPDCQHLLSPHSPSCILGALRYNIDLYPIWARLPQTIANQQPAVPPHDHLGSDPAATRRFVLGMESRAAGLLPELLPAIGPLQGTLLDLACGAGTISRHLLQNNPQLTATLFDLPPVLAVAKELAEEHQLAHRLHFVPGNYRTDSLPAPHDTILYAGALHQENPDTATTLFRAIRQALTPGGTALIFDLMTDPTGTQPLFARLFSLNMRLTSQHGRVFTTSQTETLLKTAGFTRLQTTFMPTIPYALIRAQA